MGTSLTPDFWQLFVVLVVTSVVLTVIISAALDALVVRLRQRRSPEVRPPQRVRRPRRGDQVSASPGS
ncbi:hypothetical protein [Streptomyces spectabilis]|uniref:Uncharacterized protein n=1 Tax=Streptomyces spectabilis TaxID=68270 RepID=A0A5P2XKG6_STRST|nr:hypothetical protein [Streptomyces spectabilis]MBB5102390.1 hypothetical protein [Streptomyces spectabilis]MCI3907434.1 hypothetical protein [Streptomyces spectabilis]QEV64144.1 hypothetical protein CP982_40155 [Streptomyces spectabilis]GGV32113.1 hypothetical protein GCM10010245_52150 [Streptomyces spectabilis]